MKSAVSRVVVAVSIVAALGAASACGGSGGDDGGKSRKPGAGSAKGGAAAARLEKAALATGDVKGYEVEKPKGAGNPGKAGNPGQVGNPGKAGKADPAGCVPLADILGTGTSPRPEAYVSRTLTRTDDKDSTTTRVGLSAYAEADAERLMADLRAASKAKKCATFHVGGHRYFGVRPTEATGAAGAAGANKPNVGGDEAVSYKLAHPMGEYVARQTITVVRDGGTLAVFDASNLYDPEGVQHDREAERNGMESVGTPKADEDPKVAAAIVDAQLGRL
ncbi:MULTISPECIES: hypothetical protein [Streptomyces]|uniref:hypothetical protein n=1 Tax=Streptomyces TaxID=1883 RepID=UPI001E30CD0F|nr:MULTISPECIES: hypothetical protein [Streptomyces]UFQ17529.1 hypothetical protein J2N69_22400 [Streptomyces huasconensis]WCL87134.1 hypothetical protein PPN52_22400 [Streptomyces sp. JCM 35825]